MLLLLVDAASEITVFAAAARWREGAARLRRGDKRQACTDDWLALAVTAVGSFGRMDRISLRWTEQANNVFR